MVGAARLVEMVAPALTQGTSKGLDMDGPAAAALSAAAVTRRPFRHAARSEPANRGAGCWKSARPGPWEPRAGNGPGPPSPNASQNAFCAPQARWLSGRSRAPATTHAGPGWRTAQLNFMRELLPA